MTRLEEMEKFAQAMHNLYEQAGSLRDQCSGNDKDLFNKTRGALYNLRDLATEQYYDWKEKSTSKTPRQ